jgi:hypothetical protein
VNIVTLATQLFRDAIERVVKDFRQDQYPTGSQATGYRNTHATHTGDHNDFAC